MCKCANVYVIGAVQKSTWEIYTYRRASLRLSLGPFSQALRVFCQTIFSKRQDVFIYHEINSARLICCRCVEASSCGAFAVLHTCASMRSLLSLLQLLPVDAYARVMVSVLSVFSPFSGIECDRRAMCRHGFSKGKCGRFRPSCGASSLRSRRSLSALWWKGKEKGRFSALRRSKNVTKRG